MAFLQMTGLLRRPAVLIGAVFIAGLLAGLSSPSLPRQLSPVCAGLTLLLIVVCIICRSRCSGRVRNALILLLVMTAGLLRGTVTGRSVCAAGPLDAGGSEEVVLQGMVDSDPEKQVGAEGKVRVWFQLLTASGCSVDVTLTGRGAGRVEYGDEVRVRGYGRPGRRAGSFYFRGYLDRDGILSTGGGSGYKRRLYAIRREAAGILERGISDFPGEAAVLKALVLGYRRGIDDAVKEDFTATGALHIFAISGLQTLIMYLVISA